MEKYTYEDGSTPNICIVGAGFSGLTAAIKLKTELKIQSFQLFDENPDVGGTWFVNKYPGAACDIQSHLYSWSFEQNPDWSKNYSSGSEIFQYMRKTAYKYDLYPHIKLNSKVLKMEWQDEINKWRVTILNTKTMKENKLLFDLVINGPGVLRLPSYPREFEAFKGPKAHTAEWDESVNLENKVVGVVGSGASAVQVIQEIAPQVKELYCYQRKPAWVMPRDQCEFPGWVKLLFRVIPPIMWLYRLWIYFQYEMFHAHFIDGSWANKYSTRTVLQYMKEQIPENYQRAQLTPDYTLGCKRIIKSSDYYPALALPNVKVIREKITKINGNEIGTQDGKTQKLDFLVLATGFQVQNFCEPMKIIGKDGADMMTSWKKDGPSTYCGIVTSTAPNHFILLGPHTALGHNSVVVMIECQVTFVMNVIREMLKRNAKRVTVKDSAEEEFLNAVDKDMKNTVWATGNCDSWYINAKGTVTALWPRTCTEYWMKTRKLDNSKFEYIS